MTTLKEPSFQRRNQRRGGQGALGFLTLGFLLLCCCHHGQSTSTNGTSRSDSGNALRLVFVEGGEHQRALQATLDDFTRENPGPPVRLDIAAGGGASLLGDKVRTAFAAGSPPDLFQTWSGEVVGPFIDAGLLRPLDAMFARGHWQDFLIDWAVSGAFRHGHQWGVPVASHGMAFWYRKDIFARFHVAVPESYDALEAACRALRAKDVACLSLGGKYGWMTMRLMDYFLETTCGPQLHDQLNALATSWDRPEVVAAFSLMQRWATEGWLASGFLTVSPEDARLPFYRGDAAMVFEGDWLEDQMTKEDEQDIERYDFFVPPTGHAPTRFAAFSEFLVVARDSPHAVRIEQLFSWMLTPGVQTRLLRDVAWTARKAITVDPGAQPRQAQWRTLLEHASTYRPTDQVFPKEVMASWFAIEDDVIAAKRSPRDAATEMQRLMEAYKPNRAAPTMLAE